MYLRDDLQYFSDNIIKFSRKEVFVDAGSYNKDTELRLKNNRGVSSRIDDSGDVVVKVNSFDNMSLSDIPTFIKMDIEVSEMFALEGAERVINENKPKLAICIYHKLEHLWEIPLYIKKLVPEYKLYIRNYSRNFSEIVLYATL